MVSSNKNRLIGLVLLILFSLSSCGKDGNGNPQQTDPTDEELIVRDWNLVSVTSNGMGINSNGFSIKFNKGGTFNFNTPGIPELPQSGTWVLTNSGNVIMLNGNVELEVGVLNVNRFVFDHSNTNFKEGNVTTEFVLEK
ncbi:hypothetical protein QWY93_17600 [Echinicola jeungdonensis]|uniref:Lipocalin-like domain-containing protein n=1 Tax=Echinicola jeungdonensis TaxID=709343 RepID=A0ABV5J0A9_9BACT|nr:hypothetical protein [Echinicola jeungdonensis]MDN3671131.1 hypothetical protein [Echinicola jeungdonensis]